MTTRLYLDTADTLARALDDALTAQGVSAEQVAERAHVTVSFVHDIRKARPQRQLGKVLEVLRVLDIRPYAIPVPPPKKRSLRRVK